MADNTAGTPAAPQQGAKQDNIQKDQQGGEIRRNNRNHRRRHSGQRQQRPNDENRQRQAGEKGQKGGQQPREKGEGREIKPAREQGQKRRKPIDGQNRDNRDPQIKREKRQRFIEDDREKVPSVKKVETIDDIRSDNARITKEIYQVIASMKDITIE